MFYLPFSVILAGTKVLIKLFLCRPGGNYERPPCTATTHHSLARCISPSLSHVLQASPPTPGLHVTTLTTTDGRRTHTSFLGAFENLRNRLLASSCMSVRPPYGTTGLPLEDFHEILYLSVFRKSFRKIEISLKSDNNNVTALYMQQTDRPVDIHNHISLSSS
jgi:hypothetical protein